MIMVEEIMQPAFQGFYFRLASPLYDLPDSVGSEKKPKSTGAFKLRVRMPRKCERERGRDK